MVLWTDIYRFLGKRRQAFDKLAKKGKTKGSDMYFLEALNGIGTVPIIFSRERRWWRQGEEWAKNFTCHKRRDPPVLAGSPVEGGV
jgi:hypothetical protein